LGGSLLKAYLDTSAAIGLLFGEARAQGLARTLKTTDQLLSASLIVAELLGAFHREGRPLAEADPMLDAVSLITTSGSSLVEECAQVLELGYLRGADLWHLASAVFIAGAHRAELLFISLDDRQRAQAKKLGFGVWPRT
jgi:predicted nucleic acid-binding protein